MYFHHKYISSLTIVEKTIDHMRDNTPDPHQTLDYNYNIDTDNNIFIYQAGPN